MEEAEKFFLLALQEAKEGFGEMDPHVASACNNLVCARVFNNLFVVMVILLSLCENCRSVN